MRDGLARCAPLPKIKTGHCGFKNRPLTRLVADGFRVINEGRAIYFPSHGRQGASKSYSLSMRYQVLHGGGDVDRYVRSLG